MTAVSETVASMQEALDSLDEFTRKGIDVTARLDIGERVVLRDQLALAFAEQRIPTEDALALHDIAGRWDTASLAERVVWMGAAAAVIEAMGTSGQVVAGLGL